MMKDGKRRMERGECGRNSKLHYIIELERILEAIYTHPNDGNIVIKWNWWSACQKWGNDVSRWSCQITGSEQCGIYLMSFTKKVSAKWRIAWNLRNFLFRIICGVNFLLTVAILGFWKMVSENEKTFKTIIYVNLKTSTKILQLSFNLTFICIHRKSRLHKLRWSDKFHCWAFPRTDTFSYNLERIQSFRI